MIVLSVKLLTILVKKCDFLPSLFFVLVFLYPSVNQSQLIN